MKCKNIIILLILTLLPLTAYPQVNIHRAMPQLEEEDGSPTGWFWKWLFPNGSVTDNTDGTASISFENPLNSVYLRQDGTRAMTGPLKLHSNSTGTQAGELRWSSTDTEPQYYDGSNWHYMGSPKQITATDTSQAEGNNSLTGLANKYAIKWLFIDTTSTDWTLTIYTKDDYATGELELIPNRDGDCYLYIDLPWQDADSTSEFHYNFTSASGSETHDITFYGEQMK